MKCPLKHLNYCISKKLKNETRIEIKEIFCLLSDSLNDKKLNKEDEHKTHTDWTD